MTGLTLRLLDAPFTVCKVSSLDGVDLDTPTVFIARTDEELSVVCETARAPANTTAREDGWRAMQVAGPLAFEMVGILANLSKALADGGISLFAVSTYDTDYLLVKAESLGEAVRLLRDAGHSVEGC